MTWGPFHGFLFDLDGTLIDSLPAVDRAWAAWAKKVGLKPEEVLPRIHGRRSLDSVRDIAPHLDAEEEDAWLRARETEDTQGVAILPGARELIERASGLPWGIVTSGTKDVATARMRAVGLPVPEIAVFGEDVENGKPLPDPFLLGCRKLGLRPGQILAFEDTQAGVHSVLAAGCWCVWHKGPTSRSDRVLCVQSYREIDLALDPPIAYLKRVV